MPACLADFARRVVMMIVPAMVMVMVVCAVIVVIMVVAVMAMCVKRMGMR
jgi:hypothetical protein